MTDVSDFARTAQAEFIRILRRRLGVNTDPSGFVQRVLNDLTAIENDIPKMIYSFED